MCKHTKEWYSFVFMHKKRRRIKVIIAQIFCIALNAAGVEITILDRPVSERLVVHIQQMRNPKTRQITLSEHLDTCCDGNITVLPVYKFKADTTQSNKSLDEDYFITFPNKNRTMVDNSRTYFMRYIPYMYTMTSNFDVTVFFGVCVRARV